MGRPSKTTAVIRDEKKSHRTKSELKARENGEKSVLTGEKMRESAAVKKNPLAHAYWGRVRKLMAKIGRDDAIHENVMNRYVMMLAETDELMAEKVRIDEKRASFREQYEAGDITPEKFAEMDAGCFDQLNKINAAVERKRAMLLNIEKENLLTVNSGMRAVPKKADEEEADPMAAMLMRPRLVGKG